MLGLRQGSGAQCQSAMRARRAWETKGIASPAEQKRQAFMSTDTPRRTQSTDLHAQHPSHEDNSDDELPTATILIIEDNPGNRELAEQMLEAAQYRYLSTPSAEDGWSLLQRGGVDLVFADLHTNALGLIERMRANPQTAGIPIVVTSGSRGRDIQQAALDAGAANYLTKPFGYDDLISTVERCLTGKDA